MGNRNKLRGNKDPSIPPLGKLYLNRREKVRIVNLKEFRELPEGTIFAKYEPCVVENPQIKGDTWEVDFLCTDLMFYPKSTGTSSLIAAFDEAERGASVPLEVDGYGRDGCFEDGQLFAVYEKADMEQLIEELQTCLKIAYS